MYSTECLPGLNRAGVEIAVILGQQINIVKDETLKNQEQQFELID
jgi:hypothetical protein